MTTTAIGASRVASERRSGSEFVQSNECEPKFACAQCKFPMPTDPYPVDYEEDYQKALLLREPKH